jgi:hypothetical protein
MSATLTVPGSAASQTMATSMLGFDSQHDAESPETGQRRESSDASFAEAESKRACLIVP